MNAFEVKWYVIRLACCLLASMLLERVGLINGVFQVSVIMLLMLIVLYVAFPLRK